MKTRKEIAKSVEQIKNLKRLKPKPIFKVDRKYKDIELEEMFNKVAQGITIHQIADVMQVNPGTIRNVMQRYAYRKYLESKY